MRVNITGFTDAVVDAVTSEVSPSPPLFIVSTAATLPLAPLRFSTMKGVRKVELSGACSTRIKTSASPSGGNT